jgi:hypothetical protein
MEANTNFSDWSREKAWQKNAAQTAAHVPFVLSVVMNASKPAFIQEGSQDGCK